jgi:glycosyltransferase involved in cell wall biosynthesis
LQRRSGLPWVADFRDPMIEPDEPFGGDHADLYAEIERRTVRQAARCVFTTPGAARLYSERFPDQSGRMSVIENGYDEDSFAAVAQKPPAASPAGPRVLLHSGVVYPAARDPRHLFAALRDLHDAGEVTPATLRVRFRAAVYDDLLRALAVDAGVVNYVEFAPQVPYARALKEMLEVDGLLILQDANCNRQVPAKLYEYLRAGRPVLALTDRAGDTAAVLRAAGIEAIAPLEQSGAIADMLRSHLLGRLQSRATPEAVHMASRRARTARLADLLDQVGCDAAGRSSIPTRAMGALGTDGSVRVDALAARGGQRESQGS